MKAAAKTEVIGLQHAWKLLCNERMGWGGRGGERDKNMVEKFFQVGRGVSEFLTGDWDSPPIPPVRKTLPYKFTTKFLQKKSSSHS